MCATGADYYLWGCSLRIDFLKEVDPCIRGVMNVCGAKHTNTVNEGLYLPRHKGGRGLRSVENTYKEIKVKVAVKLKRNEDPRMKLVNKFHQVHLHTKSYSLFKVTFAPLPTFGNHHKIYNKYKLYLKTNKFWKFGLLKITIDRDIGR